MRIIPIYILVISILFGACAKSEAPLNKTLELKEEATPETSSFKYDFTSNETKVNEQLILQKLNELIELHQLKANHPEFEDNIQDQINNLTSKESTFSFSNATKPVTSYSIISTLEPENKKLQRFLIAYNNGSSIDTILTTVSTSETLIENTVQYKQKIQFEATN